MTSGRMTASRLRPHRVRLALCWSILIASLFVGIHAQQAPAPPQGTPPASITRFLLGAKPSLAPALINLHTAIEMLER